MWKSRKWFVVGAIVFLWIGVGFAAANFTWLAVGGFITAIILSICWVVLKIGKLLD